jgi:two-component system cell cycle response regulator
MKSDGPAASMTMTSPPQGEQKTSRFEIVLDQKPPFSPTDADKTFVAPRRRSSDPGPEASLILIAHPSNQALGTRFRLRPRCSVVLGRAASADIGMPEVSSLSREHARLTYRSESVMIEDLGSTNGTFVNEQRIEEATVLRSGDRFQAGAVHFKFLQERDVENAYHQTIHDMVVLDGLTQIANKRRFEEEAAREFARAQRYGRHFSLILFDIDQFKLVNDTYGHLCGDSVLKKIVELAGPLLRREQLIARVGGEEFAILCPEGGSEDARKLAERVRSRLARHEFAHGGASFTVTCSFGIASLGGDIATVQELYEAADRAQYRSKDAGRNTVTIWA